MKVSCKNGRGQNKQWKTPSEYTEFFETLQKVICTTTYKQEI